MMDMDQQPKYIYIRNFENGDQIHCQEIVSEAVKSTSNSVFIDTLLREITWYFIIITIALSFIVFGMPFFQSFTLIPISFILIYLFVITCHNIRAMEMKEEIANIKNKFIGENKFFLVAEGLIPYVPEKDYLGVQIYSDKKQMLAAGVKPELFRKKIVGFIAVVNNRSSFNTAWLSRIAIERTCRKLGVGSALLKNAMITANNIGYLSMECAVSEYQDPYRSLLLKNNFQMTNFYTKPMLGILFKISMYRFTAKLNQNQNQNVV